MKHETDEFDIDILPLNIHEKINPPDVIKPLLNTKQTTLEFFGEERSYLEAKEFYQHEDAWSNRLILGDSLHVMTSLIENEPLIAGHVQMIYYDPPYGINYNSNFQSSFKPAPGKKMEYRPEAITAFRDTWKYGIHSYLTTIRKQLEAAYEILADTGSIFVQISQVNVHRVRLLLDEIFGAENFMWDILFQTKTGAGANFSSTCDYILWYVKDKNLFKKSNKLHVLYLERTKQQIGSYDKIHMSDGNVIPFPKDGKIPKGGKICRYDRLTSQHTSPTDRSNPHTFPNDKTITVPSNLQWRLGHDELDKLFEIKRLSFSKDNVHRIEYPEDYPVKLDNVWTGMGTSGEKIYDVQTKTTVIERCMLMCSDPGDLVLDITNGSGVTAYVAEQHGRRWMAVDVSKLSIIIAMTRLQMAVYDWYKLKNESLGICGGLQYEEFTKLTAYKLAHPEAQEIEYRYEKPLVQKNKFRISGPFTVEAIPSPVIVSSKNQIDDSTRKIWVDTLRTTGVITNGGKLNFSNLEEKNQDSIHYIGTTRDNKRYAISFGPKNAPLNHIQVEKAIRDYKSHGVDGLLFLASIFSADAIEIINKSEDDIFSAEANNDLLIPDLKTKSSDRAFVQIGRPRMKINKLKDGYYTVECLGYDYFDVESGKLTSEGTDKIAIWMLDTDYDKRTLRPSQMFFPNTDHVDKFVNKLSKVLRGAEINEEKIDAYRRTTSLPFKLGDYETIAVKMVDMSGREVKYSKDMGDYNE